MNSGQCCSRGEVLDWINNLLGTHYTKVEETSNGAAYVQIFDALYPGEVKLGRVNYNAITEPDMVANYKILQTVFNNKNITKAIPVDTLIKGKPMAALEMLQWLKNFFEESYAGGEYDGVARRQQTHCKGPGETKGTKRASIDKKAPPRTTFKPSAPPATSARSNAPPPTGMRTVRKVAAPATSALKEELTRLKSEIDDLKSDNNTLLEERNFYFGKLQRIEALCQEKEEDKLASDVLNILYETDEEHGFVSPDELDI